MPLRDRLPLPDLRSSGKYLSADMSVADTRLRDQMNLIEESADMDHLAGSVENTGGVYFVTAFSGLLAPYWDREAVSGLKSSDQCASLTFQGGMIVGLTAYSTSAHIARATLEAVCFQTRAVLDVIEKESGTKLETLKVDGELCNARSFARC